VSGRFTSIRTLASFVVVGGLGALAYVLISTLLAGMGVTPWLASGMSYLVLIPVIYVFQRNLTFRSDRTHGTAFPRYLASQAVGFALAVTLPLLVKEAGMQPVVAFSIVALAVAATNFVLLRLWAFGSAGGNAPSVNAQYNVARPESLAVRVAAHQRRRMFAKFTAEMVTRPETTILDVGATSDRTYAASNYLEAWHPRKDRITAVGIDDASFLVDLYPGMRFVKADALDLPFGDRTFDVVHSSAVIEHVGSFSRQVGMIRECARVAEQSFFITTPNRWFPIEMHTVLPLVHWLPPAWFRQLMRLIGRGFFADENNLNLMAKSTLERAAREAGIAAFDWRVDSVRLAGWPSNLILIGWRRTVVSGAEADLGAKDGGGN